MAETAPAPVGLGQFGDFVPHHADDGRDDELRETHPARDAERLVAQI